MNKEYQTPSEPSWKELVADSWAWLRFAFQSKQPAQQPAPIPVNHAFDEVLKRQLDGGADVMAIAIAEAEHTDPQKWAGLSDAVMQGKLTPQLMQGKDWLRVVAVDVKTGEAHLVKHFVIATEAARG